MFGCAWSVASASGFGKLPSRIAGTAFWVTGDTVVSLRYHTEVLAKAEKLGNSSASMWPAPSSSDINENSSMTTTTSRDGCRP